MAARERERERRQDEDETGERHMERGQRERKLGGEWEKNYAKRLSRIC